MRKLLLFLLLMIANATLKAQAKPGVISNPQQYTTIAKALEGRSKMIKSLILPAILTPAKGSAINVLYPVNISGKGCAGCKIDFQALWMWNTANGRFDSKDTWFNVTVGSDGIWHIPAFRIDFPENQGNEKIVLWFYQRDVKNNRVSDSQMITYAVIRKSKYDTGIGPVKNGPVKVHPKDKHSLNPQPIPPNAGKNH